MFAARRVLAAGTTEPGHLVDPDQQREQLNTRQPRRARGGQLIGTSGGLGRQRRDDQVSVLADAGEPLTCRVDQHRLKRGDRRM
jgi:hypothetical protein